MIQRDDTDENGTELAAILAESDALSEELPELDPDLVARLSEDVEALAAFEDARSWDVWLAGWFLAHKKLRETLVLTFVQRAGFALAANRPTSWSGDYLGSAEQSGERAPGSSASTLEFKNFALDIGINEGRLALTFYSTAFDVGGVAFSVRSSGGRIFSHGKTDVLGRLALTVPADGFDLVVERPSH
jgi:hypothetical protein